MFSFLKISSKGNETSVSASASSGILSVLSDDFIGSIRGKMASQKLKEVSKPGMDDIQHMNSAKMFLMNVFVTYRFSAVFSSTKQS